MLNDSDAENDTLTAAVAVGPAHGTVTLNTNGGFTYTPATGYYGIDSFTANFNPKTHAEISIFMDKYEDCMRQAMGPAGQPSEDAALQLVDTLIDFGRSMALDEDSLVKAKTAMYGAVSAQYH